MWSCHVRDCRDVVMYYNVCVGVMSRFCYFFFFFVKQKTAYELRISDWSSDVCSSDLFGGSTGAIYRQFSVTIASAMILSVLVAMTLTPAMCATLLTPIEKDGHVSPKGKIGRAHV